MSFLDPALVNGKRVDFHLFDMAGSIRTHDMIVDPTAPYYVGRALDEAVTIDRGAKQRIAGAGTTTSTEATRKHKQYAIQGPTTNLCI